MHRREVLVNYRPCYSMHPVRSIEFRYAVLRVLLTGTAGEFVQRVCNRPDPSEGKRRQNKKACRRRNVPAGKMWIRFARL